MPSKNVLALNGITKVLNEKGVSSPKPGPSLYEVEYLRQMKEELELFLRSQHFNTIKEFHIAFCGDSYEGMMKVQS